MIRRHLSALLLLVGSEPRFLFVADAHARLVQLMREAITGAFPVGRIGAAFLHALNALVSQGVS